MDQYQILVEKLGKEETEASIDKKIKDMGGFLTREAAIRVLYNGLDLPMEKAKLSDVAEGANRTMIVAKLLRILPLQEFDNGKKMRKIVLSDESRERELKLWNDDVLKLNEMHTGDLLELSGVYCKNNDLSLGYSGELKVIQRASFADLGKLLDLEGLNVNARGIVESIDGEKEYGKEGEKKKMFSFTLSDWTNRARIVIWNDYRRGYALAIGSEVKVEGALAKNGELYLNSNSRLLVKKKKDGIGGKMELMEANGEKLITKMDGKDYEFIGADAFLVLGAKVAPDIALETVLELKKGSFLGKDVFIEMKDGKPIRVSIKG